MEDLIQTPWIQALESSRCLLTMGSFLISPSPCASVKGVCSLPRGLSEGQLSTCWQQGTRD